MRGLKEKQSGFSAVELLITLFVAAAFLLAGWQLYSLIINDGGKTRAESKASNVAYDYLRRYSASITDPCTASSPLSSSPLAVGGLADVTISVDITCPYVSTDTISKVTVTLNYNNPQETVVQSTLVSSSSGDSSSTLQNGLVGWWKFNGNAFDSVGSNDGTVSGATLTTGQNGQSNGAYSFDGSNDYIEINTVLSSFSEFTVSAWARVVAGPAANGSWAYIFHRSADTSVGNAIYWLGIANTGYYRGYFDGNATTGDTNITGSTSVWRLITMTSNLSTTDSFVYVDGIQRASFTQGSLDNSTSGNRVGIGGTPHDSTYRPVDGDIDDVRIYNRELTPTEVLELYNAGAS